MDSDMVVRLRTALGRVARQLNATSTGEGLTPSQASALGLIAGRGPLGVAELAELERLNPTMVSRVIGRLVALGLIERQTDPADLRSARVHITAQGTEVQGRIKAKRTESFMACLAAMPADSVTALSAAVAPLELLAAELAERTSSTRG